MATVICPKCDFVNPHGALVCQKCYTLLLDTIRINVAPDSMARPAKPTRAMTQLQAQHQAEANQLPSYALSIYMLSAKIPLSTPLVVLLTKPIIVGRSDNASEQTHLDLSRYGAAERGVSRQHLIIKRAERDIVVEDMGSSNGTWLNDTLLQPYRPMTLESGSVLRLGKFSIEIYLALPH